LSEIDTPPTIVQAYPPFYPAEAAKEGVKGKVVLRFVVTKEGIAREASVVESDPAGVFDKSALDAIYRYTFTPGTRDGQAVDVMVHVPIIYELGPEQETSNP
jgi:protein TonB